MGMIRGGVRWYKEWSRIGREVGERRRRRRGGGGGR